MSQITHSHDRGIGNFLRNRAEEGQLLGYAVDSEYGEGEVVSVERTDEPLGTYDEDDLHDVTDVHLSNGVVLHTLCGDWSDGYSEDWTTFASFEGNVENVERLYDWDGEVEAPDETLDDLPDKVDEEMQQILTTAQRAADEMKTIVGMLERLSLGQMTVAEYERAILRLEAESGGALAIEQF